jgi:mannose-6-phosphate isomerase-like protein (cupin superfamily)
LPIDVVDMIQLAHEQPGRHVLLSTPRMYAWLHVYPNPGDHDDLHCHNADQTFSCIEGECTMRFPNKEPAVLKPGTVALITGGSFYQLENSGPGPMVLMGTRSGPSGSVAHINYETRRDIGRGGPRGPASMKVYRHALGG